MLYFTKSVEKTGLTILMIVLATTAIGCDKYSSNNKQIQDTSAQINSPVDQIRQNNHGICSEVSGILNSTNTM